jgi:hypothetical protein
MTNRPTDGHEVELPGKLQALAREIHEPPAVPRDEIWARIQSARSDRPSARPPVHPSPLLVRPSARLPLWFGIAALLAIGIGVGRWSRSTDGTTPSAPTTVAAGTPRANAAVSVATANHLSRTEAFLTSVRLGERGPGFSEQARDLLLTTRFLLDARGLTDPRTRALLEDLELILVQIAQVRSQDGEELDLLNDALEQRELLPRLRKEL